MKTSRTRERHVINEPRPAHVDRRQQSCPAATEGRLQGFWIADLDVIDPDLGILSQHFHYHLAKLRGIIQALSHQGKCRLKGLGQHQGLRPLSCC